MAPQIVTVTYDSNSNTLTLAPSKVNLDLNPGDVLEWEFLNVPSDCVPGILFEQKSGVSGSAFGPFQALLLVGDTVVGRGNLGTSGTTYTYNAQLLDAKGIRTTSAGTGAVQNLVSTPDMSPITMISTTVDLTRNPVQVTIEDDIKPLRLFEGDTAIWYVSGLPADFFVNPVFTLLSGDSAVQPFRYVLFNRGVDGEGSAVLQVIGVDFQPGTTNSFTYKVQPRNFSGSVNGPVDDPQIDNLGPPPQG